MIDAPPALILILGALLIPILPVRWQRYWPCYLVGLPLIGLLNMLSMGTPEIGETVIKWQVTFLDFELTFGRIDRFSLLFGHIFSLLTVIAFIYILHTKDKLEYMSGMLYAGSALGVVFAGDLLSLFVFWELLTLCAVGCTVARRTERSYQAALRYLLMHVFGGLILLAGIVLYIAQNQTAEFGYIGLDSIAGWLIFLGFGLNCAWPFLHTWLPDTYPEASVGGVVFMATFTTKTAVYVLARSFPGEEVLLWIGAAMATFPIFYAVLENDLRRVLAYSLINQVGFMVVGIGLGTHLSLNGTGAHAYCHILYKALLFMSVGAVIYRTGKSKATELGGLYRSMPISCIFCCIGAAAISAFPFFSGFVSKSMIMSAAAENHQVVIWFVLLFASAGVLHHAGIKIPFFTFFGHDSGIRVKEAPTNMLVAMFIAAFLCISLALPWFNVPWVGYQFLYGLLPFELEQVYEPYTFAHLSGQGLLLMFSALALILLMLAGIDPPERRCVNVDFDWVYRRGAKAFYGVVDRTFNAVNAWTHRLVTSRICNWLFNLFGTKPGWFVARIQLFFMALQGADPDTLVEKERVLYRDSKRGTFAIGIAGLLVLVVFGLLFHL
ncbi:MAG: multicomponent Na+:H+ antiporter subunit D [Yoonia sp.]|jgi:multicomponent Na+:H+ antiporter subunit D